MWEIVQAPSLHLSHDLPCLRCGHPAHTYLACSDDCGCRPALMPGDVGQPLRVLHGVPQDDAA